MVAETELAALREASAALENAPPQEVLRWAVERYGSTLAVATAFGAEGCALLAMLSELDARVHVFNLDTGYQFRETLETRERIRERYGIEVQLVRATETREEMEARLGGPIHGTRPRECCRLRKVEPLREHLAGFCAWASAIRRDQSPDRTRAAIVDWDAKFGLVKISPLANWTRSDVWRYIRQHDVPYNPLHDQGYLSIGCQPCTRPVAIGQDERSGRWAGFVHTECGLHSR